MRSARTGSIKGLAEVPTALGLIERKLIVPQGGNVSEPVTLTVFSDYV